MTSKSLWNYYRDEIDDADDNVLDVKLFIYKPKIVGKHHEDQRDQNDRNSYHQIQTDINHHDHHDQNSQQYQL